MIQQSLLSHLASQHNFSRANQVIAMSQAKPFVHSWLTLDLSLSLTQSSDMDDIHFASPYFSGDEYLKFVTKPNTVEPCDKRYASKADLHIVTPGKNLWFEFHVLHQDELASKKDRNKLYDDVKRVTALRDALPGDEVMLLVGLWGSFSGEDIKHFEPLDNNRQCAYVLDTSLTGSTQIARLSQMKKEGEPRFLLAAF
ncbi:hypothetical protein L1D31_03205 [Vibrio sp. Isolate23]|uniref:hypothetical protein n=1 Tax=Vibrio sp. Isolate23 TaxID=2908533 RepID=UPI001EFDD48E|nr:hypothetical protein [Vibrio sp. Isolate23]MCG9681566.1 hypothetical protein [Vibrio sp. Isolate23]